ncbi:hypothetical protein JQ615_03890 [Bradyrhizobium jicamae]|uniref:Uncharacterized protein n=1 Tax=Bradyrhizobium jicamae TaxID=280332 RepID=A0ABS5FCL1_9BRAD|nr:hypothetical protein [Bradyrhizobium jicamae]MBR0794527.1 hypothetical protein [Bradyrhizobium jicamae]
MNPFLDVAYRIVAIALCFSCGRNVWCGLVERKITFFNTDLLDWWSPSRQVIHRETAPIRYWIVVCTQTVTSVLCFVAAIIGWWQPNS